MTRTPRVNDLRTIASRIRARVPAGLSRKTAAYAGAGLALAGVAGATAAAGLTGSTANAAAPLHTLSRSVNVAGVKQTHGADIQAPASNAPAKQTPAKHRAPAKHQAPAKHSPAKHTPARPVAPAKNSPAKHAAAKLTAPAKHTAPVRHHSATKHAKTWTAIKKLVASHTYPKATHGPLPAQDQLTPVGTSGSQASLPITAARYENAKTITRQAIAKHMGLRAAVIAVATSMQESTLLNLNYGDRDSLGLFQQRPSCGWGTPGQIEHPAYAADAFLKALRTYQASDPGWAHQPLWEAAQGVQGSAFPSAYAKWEAQAAHLVASATKHLVASKTKPHLG
jgi:hypothetical protein